MNANTQTIYSQAEADEATIIETAFAADFQFRDALGMGSANMRNVDANLAKLLNESKLEVDPVNVANPRNTWTPDDWKAARPRMSEVEIDAVIEYLNDLKAAQAEYGDDVPTYDVFVSFSRLKCRSAKDDQAKGPSGRIGYEARRGGADTNPSVFS